MTVTDVQRKAPQRVIKSPSQPARTEACPLACRHYPNASGAVPSQGNEGIRDHSGIVDPRPSGFDCVTLTRMCHCARGFEVIPLTNPSNMSDMGMMASSGIRTRRGQNQGNQSGLLIFVVNPAETSDQLQGDEMTVRKKAGIATTRRLHQTFGPRGNDRRLIRSFNISKILPTLVCTLMKHVLVWDE